MSDFIAQAAQLAADNSGVDSTTPWLSELNKIARNQWLEQTLPTRKTESWKYTSLKALETQNYLNFADPRNSDDNLELADLYQIPDLDGIKIVFVNGYYCAELSSVEAHNEGANISRNTSSGNSSVENNSAQDDGAIFSMCAFSKASQAQKSEITKHLNTVIEEDQHPFAALNMSCTSEGVFIQIHKNKVQKQAIHIVSVSTAQTSPFMVNQRALIVLEEGSQATIVEHYVSTFETQSSLVNSVSEIRIGDNAQLQHYRLHEEDESAIHIGGMHVELNKSALIDSFHLALGGVIKRIDIVVHHRGEGAHSELNGVYLPRNKQQVDYHTCIEHATPHCTSNEVFRGIISDSAKAVFYGRIHIHKHAQKTFAQLSNKNLLTSNKAEVDTKPELEIYADDVQCAHGATVAQLDTDSLHYFKTRGISTDKAMVMLSFGFINELINQIKQVPVGDYLRPKLARLFTEKPTASERSQ